MTAPSPFRSAAAALRANGYSVLPLRGGQKAPISRDWSRFCDAPADDATFGAWLGWPGCNLGVCLGPASGLTALDFDDDVDGAHARVLKVVGDSPVKKAGAKGFTAFYRFGNERSAGYSLQGVRVLDVLAGGRQTVLPPSLHPSGAEYRWITERTLKNTPASELPPISPAAMAEVMRLFRSDQPAPRPPHRDGFDFGRDDEVAEALAFLPSDDHDLWIRVGMALKSGRGEAGYALWDAWSARSAKYKGPGETRRRWVSFKREGVNIESLFWKAIHEGGYRPEREPHASAVAPGGNLERGREAGVVEEPPGLPRDPAACHAAAGGEQFASGPEPEPDLERLRDRVLDAPGLPGMVASYINQTALYPQPLLALGAALAFSGLVMAHKVRGETNLRTNLYALGVAESGAGKDHARQAVKALLAQCGLSHLEMGVPASGASLKTVLVERDGKALALIDEFGKFFGNITGRNSGSHQQEITTTLMELFTSSSGTWVGKQYADSEKNPPKPVVQPCLCMYPVTTPDTFYGSLSIKDAVDGLLARFLVFESRDYPTEEQEGRRDPNDIPETLRDAVEFWKQVPVNSDPSSNMGSSWVSPKVVPYTDAARAMRKDYTRRHKERAKAEIARGNPFAPIYGRVGEIAGKVALIGHAGDSISEDVMAWAIDVTTYCSEYMVQVVRKVIGENEHERSFKRLVGIVAKLCAERGEAAHSDVVRKAQFLTKKERSDMLDDAVASGLVTRHAREREGRPGPPAVYYQMGRGA